MGNTAARIGCRDRLMNDCRRLGRCGNSFRIEGDIAEEQVRLSQLHIVDPAQLARHVAGKGKDWRMVAGCFIKAGDKVCTTRTGRARAYAETTSQLGLPGGRECRSFLVPDADPLYRAAANRVAQRVEGVADQPEDLSNPDLFQHADQNVCDHLSHFWLLRCCDRRHPCGAKNWSRQKLARASVQGADAWRVRPYS